MTHDEIIARLTGENCSIFEQEVLKLIQQLEQKLHLQQLLLNRRTKELKAAEAAIKSHDIYKKDAARFAVAKMNAALHDGSVIVKFQLPEGPFADNPYAFTRACDAETEPLLKRLETEIEAWLGADPEAEERRG